MGMLMPGPGRGEDQIALLHRARLAVDDGARARAFQHEAQRIHGVTVRPRAFARQQHLDGSGERLRRLRSFLLDPRRRDELQHPPLDRLRRGDLDRAGDQRTDFLPRPQIAGLGRRRRPVRELVLPQRREIGFLPRLAKRVDISLRFASAAAFLAATADMAVNLSAICNDRLEPSLERRRHRCQLRRPRQPPRRAFD